VLDEGEDLNLPRVIDAAGPAAVVLYHATYERGGATAFDALPGGRAWREAIEAYPENERHLVIHEGHLNKANPRDEPHVADLMAFASMGLPTIRNHPRYRKFRPRRMIRGVLWCYGRRFN
jgi:5,10-methylenetetrahydromethanopterin reductase